MRCQGKNCGSHDVRFHSAECLEEHERTVNGGFTEVEQLRAKVERLKAELAEVDRMLTSEIKSKDGWYRRWKGLTKELAALRSQQAAVPAWQPIETAPKGANGYAWMLLAWGVGDDPHTAEGMRYGDKFFAAGTFYCLGQEKKYELREVEVHPTHWMPLPAAPGEAPQPSQPKKSDAFDICLLQAAAKSGDEGAMRLAAQLAGVPPCDGCGYRKEYCRCEQPSQQAGPEWDHPDVRCGGKNCDGNCCNPANPQPI